MPKNAALFNSFGEIYGLKEEVDQKEDIDQNDIEEIIQNIYQSAGLDMPSNH